MSHRLAAENQATKSIKYRLLASGVEVGFWVAFFMTSTWVLDQIF